MYCRFESRPQRKPSPLSVNPPPPSDPMTALLERLVGRTVTVLAGGFLITGKLVSVAPVSLVGETGVVSVITSPVVSVQF